MDKIDDQKSGHPTPGANERLRLQQIERQTLGLGEVNRWMYFLEKLKDERASARTPLEGQVTLIIAEVRRKRSRLQIIKVNEWISLMITSDEDNPRIAQNFASTRNK